MLVHEWPDDWQTRWPNFTVAEMACKCGCGALPDPLFMNALQRLRRLYGWPMPVTSGARCDAHDDAIARQRRRKPYRVHTTGLAADFLVDQNTDVLMSEIYGATMFTGKGLRQHGQHAKRFIHLDTLPINVPGAPDYDPTKHPRPWIWTYK